MLFSRKNAAAKRSSPEGTRLLSLARRLCLAASFCGGVLTLAQPAAAADQTLLAIEQGSHSAPVRRIDADPARGVVVTASDDRTARVWDVASGELRHVLRPRAFGAEGGRMYAAAIQPGHAVVAVGGTTGGDGNPHLIYLFNLETGALQRTIDARAGDVRRLVWSRDGTVLLAGYAGANGVKAFSADGKLLHEDQLGGPVYGIAVSTTGLAAVVSLDGGLRVYRAQGGAVAAVANVSLGRRRAAGASFSPDGRQLAVAYANSSVGANGRENIPEPVEILESESGRSLGQLPAVPTYGGDFRVVAWSPDGRSIYAAGTAYSKDFAFPVVQYDAVSRSAVSTSNVASDSVTDLVALASGGVAFSSFDGSWGVLSGGKVTPRVAPSSTVVRGDTPEDLELGADARSVRWGSKTARGGLGFQFERRQVGADQIRGARAPEASFGLFDRPTGWNLSRGTPTVAGKPLAMVQDERSRALVVIRSTRSAVFGTNRALYRVDEKGDLLWRVPVDTEVRAVNASEDGRWIVSAMADSSIRWWRARDGKHLLSLLSDAEGRWVLWTPSGYYDASAGADRLVGWAVGKDQQPTMDFYSLNRFRDRFNRPDVIDTLLDTQDEKTALETLRKREVEARELAANEARAREQEAVAAARAAALAAEEQRRAEALQARLRQEAEQAARDASAKAEIARIAEAKRVAARQQAEREAAEREAAARLAEAREAAAREAANRQAQLEAEQNRARLAAEQAAALKLAAARELAAAQARLEAEAREATLKERKALEVVKALEVPPALTAAQAKRIRLDASEVTLQFAVTSAGAAKSLALEVRVNGRPVQASELVLPKSLDGSARGYAKLNVTEGESLVEILAKNEFGYSEPLSFQVERASAAPVRGAGDLYVLSIGVSEYFRAEYRLGLASKDAADFGNAMKQQEGKQYRKVVVRELLDREATLANITKALEWLRQAAGPSDVAMLFMAGHGINDEAGQYFYLPADAQLERLASTGLPQGAIVSALSMIRAKTLLFLDTCFAGNTFGALRKAGRQTERMMNDLSSSENGVVVFASSTGQEESEEKAEWGNGAFTKALLEGLRGKADFMRAGRVTYAALNLFISEEVTRLTQGRQRPVFISPRGIPDFTLARL
jgi:WD40 repeat protein